MEDVYRYIMYSKFGYKPRYEPRLHRSLKRRKYETQSFEELVHDTPRLLTNNVSNFKRDYEIEDPEEVEKMFLTLLEHSRVPGWFDYSQPQTYHSLFPDIEQNAYVEIGGNKHRKLAISNFSA